MSVTSSTEKSQASANEPTMDKQINAFMNHSSFKVIETNQHSEVI